MSDVYPCEVKPFTNDHKLYKPINGYYGGTLVNKARDRIGFYGHVHGGTIHVHSECWVFDPVKGWKRDRRAFRIDPADYQAFLDMLVKRG
jgi:hypothetical protein